MGAAAAGPWLASVAAARPVSSGCRVLVLVELEGGNDALNTIAPYADSRYYALRPRLAIPRAAVVPLDGQAALHPALRPLMRWWNAGELAVIRGVGDPAPSLSHLRAIAAWDSAVYGDRHATPGWAARALGELTKSGHWADGIAIDSAPGPLAGWATTRFSAPPPAAVDDPDRRFRAATAHAAHFVRAAGGPVVIKLSLKGFDTHAAQAPVHARRLATLSGGLARLAVDIQASGLWDSTLILTYSEFGRRAAENEHGGTDHGTSGMQFALGGRVRGGLYGGLPRLDRRAECACDIDFRRVYATVVERGWGLQAASILGQRHAPLEFLGA